MGMNTYVIRTNWADGFEVSLIEADNYGAAVALAMSDPDAVSALVLGTIDREPQAYLAALA